MQSVFQICNLDMGLRKGSWKYMFPGCFGSARSRNVVLKRTVKKRLCSSRIAADLDVFTLAEVKQITHNFSMSSFVGEGGFGPVYKGVINEKIRPGFEALPVAVKVLDLDGHQGHREWLVGFFSFFFSSSFKFLYRRSMDYLFFYFSMFCRLKWSFLDN